MSSSPFPDPRKEEEDAPTAPEAPPSPPPVAGKEDELPAPAPAAQTAPPLPLPVAGKEQEQELPAPAPAAQTAPPLPPPVAGKEQEEDLPAPAPVPRTILGPYVVGGGGGGYHTSSDYVVVGGGGDGDAVGWSVGWSGGPAPTPWRPEDFEFILAGIKPIHTSAADQDQDQVDIRKAKRLVGKDLEKEFKAASAFVQACTFGVPEGHYLRFYGLHKVATEGLCYAPQPSPRNLKSHAEWNSWNNLCGMHPEEAMEEYVTTARELFPSWAHAYNTRMKDEETCVSATGSEGPRPTSKTNESELGDIHVSAREGASEDLKKHLAAGVEINTKDSEEKTPLHWAVDRGHLDAVEFLVSSNADINAQDTEGQTPLHYAVRREGEDIAQLLVNHQADLQIKDGHGNTAPDLCSSAWPFLKPAN